ESWAQLLEGVSVSASRSQWRHSCRHLRNFAIRKHRQEPGTIPPGNVSGATNLAAVVIRSRRVLVAHAPSKARSAAGEVGQENVAFIIILVPKAMGILLRAVSALST